jgi:outer membrane protein TolC
MKRRQLIIVFLLLSSLQLLAQQSVSLSQCQKKAMQHNQKLKKAQKETEAAGYMEKAAFTRFLPEFSAEGTYMRLNKPLDFTLEEQYLPVTDYQGNVIFVTDPNGNPVPGPDGNPIIKNYAWLPEQNIEIGEENIYMAAATMSQIVYAGGKVRESYKMAGYSRQIAHSKENLTEAELKYETAKYYWTVVSVKEKVKLVEAYQEQIDQLISDLENYKSEGVITNNDLLKAQVKRNEVQLQLIKAENGLKLAQMALNQMIGAPLDTVIQLSDSLGSFSLIPDSAGYREVALANRPELKMLEQKVLMAESGVELSKSRFMPNIALTANYYALNPNPYNGFQNEFGGDWMIGVACQVPLFHWGDKFHTLNASRLKKEASEMEFKEVEEKIQLQVQQHIFRFQEAIKQIEMTNISLKQADENLKITRDTFNEGLATTAEVLEAQAMWQKAKAENIEAKTALQMSWLALQKATGKL